MRYKPLPTKGDVTPETALIQAAYALDAAATVAENINDVEGLLNVAAMWGKLSQDFHEFASTVVPIDERGQPKVSTGFQRNEIIAGEEESARVEHD